MALDWFSFLRQHGIRYTTEGPNASRGRVNIKCPFCGNSDPSEHLGISLSGHGYSCWRDASHRGRDQSRLVAILAGVSIAEARRITGGAAPIPPDEELAQSVRKKLGVVDAEEERITTLEFPPEFKSLNTNNPFSDQFRDYLTERGYKKSQLKWLVDTYDLQYATRGRFRYRIVIPVLNRWNELQTWTARSILPDQELRYLSLKADQQICAPKETLLGLPLLWSCPSPRALVICEGPFDAFWITAYGRSMGVYATCLFGLSMQPQQAELLAQLRQRFPYMTVLLDESATMQAVKMASYGIRLAIDRLPSNVKDPATMSVNGVIDLCSAILSRAT